MLWFGEQRTGSSLFLCRNIEISYRAELRNRPQDVRKSPERKGFVKKRKLLMIQGNRWEGDMEDDIAAA